ncbi:MAG: hypothetical protein HXX10_13285 [Rhodoplanes sp.]|uniref:hypothetical protein n=1 Tax=Rhodoplanes sp. TaxID=1968906 RepID=UPI0018559C33|nr:hypothetical protein [Rhodoplanes sp.]NVO15003.1 hypothetical protein [Rhodoplanes sp.]
MSYTPVLVEMIAAGVVLAATFVWHFGWGRRRDAERLAALRGVSRNAALRAVPPHDAALRRDASKSPAPGPRGRPRPLR